MTRADLKHCGKIPDAREELNRSVREGRIESRHSINSLEGMGSSSHDLGAELRMHSFTVNCDTFSNEEKVAAVVPVTSVVVTCSEAMLAMMHQLGGKPTKRNVMLLGAIAIFCACMPHFFISETTVIERGDTTRLAVVPSEPSEAVNE